LGLFALLCLGVLAATSHDFWLAFLGAPLWKRLHLLIYPAYAAVVGHVALGALQDATNPSMGIVVGGGALTVAALHLLAWRRGAPVGTGEWRRVADLGAFEDGRAVVVRLGGDERAAVFRVGGALHAVSNACAHQGGPLGEGRVIDGCITCPWHGFQYRPEDGCSPPPFTERIATYPLRLEGREVQVRATADPPGTRQVPLKLPEAGA
ncbi:MAG: Rieske 2Fe-2S domain-containing protein, partial [Pseudomonadota bacterium]